MLRAAWDPETNIVLPLAVGPDGEGSGGQPALAPRPPAPGAASAAAAAAARTAGELR